MGTETTEHIRAWSLIDEATTTNIVVSFPQNNIMHKVYYERHFNTTHEFRHISMIHSIKINRVYINSHNSTFSFIKLNGCQHEGWGFISFKNTKVTTCWGSMHKKMNISYIYISTIDIIKINRKK